VCGIQQKQGGFTRSKQRRIPAASPQGVFLHRA
jgi:hypothetical protein